MKSNALLIVKISAELTLLEAAQFVVISLEEEIHTDTNSFLSIFRDISKHACTQILIIPIILLHLKQQNLSRIFEWFGPWERINVMVELSEIQPHEIDQECLDMFLGEERKMFANN